MASYVKKLQNVNNPHVIRYQHDGRQKEKGFPTKRLAMDFKAKFEHDSREQIFVDPKESSIKFREAARHWITSRQGADSSKRVYRNALAHLDPLLGDKSLRHVANDRYGLTTILTETLPAKGLGASMVRICYIVVRAVVNDTIRAGKLNASRINGIKLPSAPVKAYIIWPTHAQLTTMAESMGQYGSVLWLMRGCGLRIGEALGVRWEDFKDGTLRVSQQLCPDGVYRPLKHRKAEEYRDVPVPDYVMAAIFGDEAEDRYGYVYAGANRQAITRAFNKARDLAELDPDFTPHTLRHIFASVSLSNKVPITDVSAWLGHRDINMTYSIYGHLVPSSWATARDVLDNEFSSWKGEA